MKYPDVRNVYYNEKIKCNICNEKLLKLRKDGTPYSLICIPCSIKQEKVTAKLKRKSKVIKKFYNRVCPYCTDSFTTELHRKIYCNDDCSSKQKIKLANEKEYVSRKPISLKTVAKLEQSHAYVKEPEYLKKFKAVRG